MRIHRVISQITHQIDLRCFALPTAHHEWQTEGPPTTVSLCWCSGWWGGSSYYSIAIPIFLVLRRVYITDACQYPTEYVKTRRQLLKAGGSESTMRILSTAIRTEGLRVLYTGAGAFCLSNTMKSGVRFLTFDTVRDGLPRDVGTGKPTATSTMIAGVAAGVAESVSVVTPGENIKTKMILSQQRTQHTSAVHIVRAIVHTDGFKGLFRGVAPVTLKQGSNALIRFTSYSTILDAIQPSLQSAGQGGSAPPIAGAAAGIITVYGTMPFDVIKTRMQSEDAGSARQGLRASFTAIARESSISGFWKGTTPRLVRLSVS